MTNALLRFCYVTCSAGPTEKPWGVDWSLFEDKGRIQHEGPFRTEAEAQMKVNALKVIYQLRPLRQTVSLTLGAS